MTTRYWLNILDLTGSKVAQLSDSDANSGFQYLIATKKRNDVGILRATISYDIPQAAVFNNLTVGQMLMAELKRSDPDEDIATYTEWRGFVRPVERTAEGKSLPIEIWGVHENALLEWRRVMWPASTSNRSIFSGVAAETVAKLLVQYNVTASATTANGRATNGANDDLPVTVEADAAQGNTISASYAWLNLLPALQRVATLGGGDWSLEYSEVAHSWEFQWHQPYLGTDRSAEVVFSLDRNNMQRPVLNLTNPWEPTVAVVAGQGQGSDRALVVRTGPNYISSSFTREVFIDARDLSATAALEDRGDQKLNELMSRNALDFTVLQTDSLRYGRDYFLGDLVSWRFSGLSGTQQIDSAEIELSDGQTEQIKIGLRDV
jgi:hypothetical protein